MLKLLCLHGYRQNGELLAKSAETLQKKFNKKIILVYLDSPFLIEKEEIGYEAEVKRRKWWSLKEKEDLFRPINYDYAAEAMAYVASKYNNQNFDGILGFSQGSVMVQLLLLNRLINPRFAILIGTFPITDIRYQDNNDFGNTPLLFCVGARDELVPPINTYQILENYKGNFTICKYSGGHHVPSNSQAFKEIESFLTLFIKV